LVPSLRDGVCPDDVALDANGQALAYVHSRDNPAEAQQAKVPDG
jgi:hypothetical protein